METIASPMLGNGVPPIHCRKGRIWQAAASRPAGLAHPERLHAAARVVAQGVLPPLHGAARQGEAVGHQARQLGISSGRARRNVSLKLPPPWVVARPAARRAAGGLVRDSRETPGAQRPRPTERTQDTDADDAPPTDPAPPARPARGRPAAGPGRLRHRRAAHRHPGRFHPRRADRGCAAGRRGAGRAPRRDAAPGRAWCRGWRCWCATPCTWSAASGWGSSPTSPR
jgi:hypothetical protein